MKIIKFCKSYLLSQKVFLFLFIFFSFLGSLVSIISPYLLGDFIDNLVAGANERDIYRFCIIFSWVVFFRIFKDYVTSMLYTKMQVEMGYKLNMEIIKHLQKLSISYFCNKNDEYLNQRINGDCYALITFCLSTLRDIITNFILFIFPLFILFLLNFSIFGLLSSFILLYVIVYSLMKKAIYNSGLMYKEYLARFFASIFEQISHITQIKINSVQREFNKRTELPFLNYKKVAIKSQQMNYLYSSLDGVIGALAQIVLFITGGLLVIQGKFTVGMFTIFNSYFRMILSSCSYFFDLAAKYQVAMTSLNRTKDILNYAEEPNGKIRLRKIDSIELKNLSFAYYNHKFFQNSILENNEQEDHYNLTEEYLKRDVVKSFSYLFCSGKIYGIVGQNGTGKTTLTKLIIGLYGDERSGNISYNNIPIEEIDLVYARRELIGYAEQDPFLVEDSIYYNLAYEDFKDCLNNLMAEKYDQLKQLSQILNMENFFIKNPIFGDSNKNNINFSGGEKQKIEILKVLYKNSSVMVFDEPTSGLDKKTKKRFLYHLTQLKKDKIIFVVTHDNEVIAHCDEVVCI